MKREQGTFHDLGNMQVTGFGRRPVRVYVPTRAALHDGGESPALFLLDGQNVFDDAGSFAGGWHAHQAVERISPLRHQVPVIVSLGNGGLQRFEEMTPWQEAGRGGRADDFMGWVADVLVPRMQRRFGLGRGPRHTFIGGSSLGGLASLYAHHRWPEVFGGALCMSSSLFWADRRIFEYVRGRPVPKASRIYLDCGGREAKGRMLRVTLAMGSLLEERGYGSDNLLVVGDARGQHHESAWARRLPRALRFLFAR